MQDRNENSFAFLLTQNKMLFYMKMFMNILACSHRRESYGRHRIFFCLL